MSTLIGTGHGAGSVFARAVLLTEGGGRAPTLTEEVMAEASRLLRRREAPLDIVLVARDAVSALFLRLPPGLSVVGVVAESADVPPVLPDDVCLIAGVADALAEIPDGEWLLLDPRRGRVVVGPDATDIARMQTGSERPRILLGAAHVPARTQGGHEVSVWALTRIEGDLATAMAQGADGVVLPVPGALLAADASEDPVRPLLRVAAAVGGGPVGLLATPDDLDPAALTFLAAHCRAHWLIRPGDLPLPVAALREELTALVFEAEEENQPAGLPRLVAVLPEDGEPEDLSACDELLVLCDSGDGAGGGTRLAAAAALARKIGLPLRAWIEEDTSFQTLLSPAVREGVAGVLVAPGRVEDAKYRIRAEE